MPDDISLKIDTSQFDAMLTALPTKVAGRIMKDALQAGGDVLLASMKALCPERTDEPTPDEDSLPPGILREDLHTQVTVTSTTGARLRVGPTDIAAHVARWQENGWMLTLHNGKKVRQIPGKHFMAASVDEAGEAAVDAFVARLAEGLNGTADSEG
jgi:hypothetical protein